MMEDGRRKMKDEFHSLLVSLYFLYVSVSLQIPTLAQNMLSTMVAGDASQTTPVQIMHIFMMCCFTHIELVQF